MESLRTQDVEGSQLSEEEVEVVAELLARIGGNWYPERTRPALRAVGDRHREVARLIISTVKRSKAASQSDPGVGVSPEGKAFNFAGGDQLHVGATVIYRPPGEKRALTCRIERMERGRAYLVPAHREIGWVSPETLLLSKQ
ncbi:hypothetical protein [Microvirga alba]|uniref:Uncharacterized protein n=1 Tax=Microvirga alba TaxID=2791025 RepID=A0A931BNL2_9HYPH|nr:hypothetical protein [Microvirga alba]MBF9232575.1 hypothetical protein [Microvirga alba]